MGDLCCSLQLEESVCRFCGSKGKSVQDVTLRSLVKEGVLSELDLNKKFYFCPNPECEVVYFENSTDRFVGKNDLKVRVGLKEKEPPRTVCYCFDITREMLEAGDRDYLGYIKERVRRGECECEVRNPSGRCCLADVRKVLNELKEV